MRRTGILIVIVAIATALIVSSLPAGAGGQSTISKLTKKVNKLQKRVAGLEGAFSCLGIVGMTSFGNPDSGIGYLYSPDGQNTQVTTGLDFDGSQTPQVFSVAVDPNCVGRRIATRKVFPRMHPSRAPAHKN